MFCLQTIRKKSNSAFLLNSIFRCLSNKTNEMPKSDRKELVKTREEKEEIDQSLLRNIIPTKSPIEDFRIKMITRKKLDTVDLFLALQRRYDFSLDGFKRMLINLQDKRESYMQRFIPRRHGILGLINIWFVFIHHIFVIWFRSWFGISSFYCVSWRKSQISSLVQINLFNNYWNFKIDFCRSIENNRFKRQMGF